MSIKIIIITLFFLRFGVSYSQKESNKLNFKSIQKVYGNDTLLSYVSFSDNEGISIDFQIDSLNSVKTIFYSKNRTNKQITIDQINVDTAVVYIFTKSKKSKALMHVYLNDELLVSGKILFNAYVGKWKQYNKGEVVGSVIFDEGFVASETEGISGEIKRHSGEIEWIEMLNENRELKW